MRQVVAFGIAIVFAFAVSTVDVQAQCCGNSGVVGYGTPMTYNAPGAYSSYGYSPQSCNQCCTVRRGLFRTRTYCSTNNCCGTTGYAAAPVAYTGGNYYGNNCGNCNTCCTTRPTIFPRRTATYCSTCCNQPCNTGCNQQMYGATTMSGCAGCAGGTVMMSPTMQGVPAQGTIMQGVPAQGTIIQPQAVQQGTVSPPTPDDT
ncbi:MAG: hypothetical protein ACR2NP_01675 [Pirellulaceae bacterium]